MLFMVAARATLVRASTVIQLPCLVVIRPDLVCYNCAVRACGSSGEYAQALGVMDVSLLSANTVILEEVLVMHWFL